MKIFMFLFLLANSCLVLSASQTGEVTGYIPYSSGDKEILLLKLENNLSGGCNSTARYAMDSNNLKFKGTQAAVIAAFHANVPIKVKYVESCNAWNNSWDISLVCIGSIPC